MRQGCLAVFAIVVAIAVAVLLTRLFDRATGTVDHPEPMRPAVATIAPCPPGHAMIAQICVEVAS